MAEGRCEPRGRVSAVNGHNDERIMQAAMVSIAFISAHPVAPEVQTQRLVVLGAPVWWTWNILQPASRCRSPLAEAFSHFVLEQGARCDAALSISGPA